MEAETESDTMTQNGQWQSRHLQYHRQWRQQRGPDDEDPEQGQEGCKSTVFYRTPAPIIVYYFPYITCLLYLLFLIKHVRTSG